MENQYVGVIAKKGGAWTICWFKGGGEAWQERVGWCFWGGGWYPNAHYDCVDVNFTNHTLFIAVKGSQLGLKGWCVFVTTDLMKALPRQFEEEYLISLARLKGCG